MHSTVHHSNPTAKHLVVSVHLREIDLKMCANVGVTEHDLLELARKVARDWMDAVWALLSDAQHTAADTSFAPLPRPAPAELPPAPLALPPGS